MKVAALFENFGPYHVSRLGCLAEHCRVLGIEENETSLRYDWKTAAAVPFERKVLGPQLHTVNGFFMKRRKLYRILEDFAPDVVMLPGWSSALTVAALRWARMNAVKVVLMSESQKIDSPRRNYSEAVKTMFLSLCDTALVGGRRHADYLVELGMPRDRIHFGYDAVDNDHFTSPVGTPPAWLPERYFLASARFIPKKNLSALIEAFSIFLRGQSAAGSAEQWNLIILGDGDMRREIESDISRKKLTNRVHMPGFVQYEHLPHFYKGAQAFVHCSSTEQWGLVVNEAMAASLPVIVSQASGASELVESGVNGFTFESDDVTRLAEHMASIAGDASRRQDMGAASAKTIRDWGAPRFGSGGMAACAQAMELQASSKRWQSGFLLTLMLMLAVRVDLPSSA